MTTVLQPGATLDGKYRLTRRIGEGGMGTVFEGENIRIRRKVAIKVLHDHVATSPEFAQRFVREARASARIGSEYVCDVLDLGDLESGEKYIVMELLDGESMEARLERESQIDPKVLAPLIFEILEGLGAMHQVGVIHRDLKPANVFLVNKKGGGVSVKILDFGVAKVDASDEDPSGIHDMTTTGTMMGTPLYMSPEQARGARDVDGRTDLYAASAIFYQGLTGETPHTGVSLHELLFKIVLDDPKPIQSLAPQVDDELAGVVMRGLARDPEQRFLSARAYQEALAAWASQHGLSFTITLPDAAPVLRKQTGGFPAAIIETAGAAMRTGNTPVSVDPSRNGEAKSIDVNAVTQPSNPPQPPPTSGTLKTGASPIAESTPEPPATSIKPGDTLIAGVEPPAKAASVAPPPESAKPESSKASASPPEPEATGSSKKTILIGVAVALVAAIVGIVLGSADAPGPAPAPSAEPTPSAAPSAAVAPVPHASTHVEEPEAPAPSASVDAEAPAKATAAPLGAPAPVAKPSASTSKPPPAVSGRQIRTEPGF